jgi:hypothetical protein
MVMVAVPPVALTEAGFMDIASSGDTEGAFWIMMILVFFPDP